MTAPTVTVSSGPTLYEVVTPSGHKIQVMGQSERQFYRELRKKYETENRFTAATDVNDLERLLTLELLVFRWTGWITSGKDYDGLLSPSTEDQLRKNLKETSATISQIKNDLGLTRSQREKEQFESVGAYLTKIKTAAKEQGVRREKQLAKALCLLNELFSLVGTMDRANEHERAKLDLSPEEILDWIRNVARPEYEAIDAHFRNTQQRYWLRSL